MDSVGERIEVENTIVTTDRNARHIEALAKKK
jgi:hypothetical protein